MQPLATAGPEKTADGSNLDVPAGTSDRFMSIEAAPYEDKTVRLEPEVISTQIRSTHSLLPFATNAKGNRDIDP